MHRKAGHHPDHIYFVVAGDASGAASFPTHALGNGYVFQVGYHEEYGLTGALPDDTNDIPQGYERGDLAIGEFFEW